MQTASQLSPHHETPVTLCPHLQGRWCAPPRAVARRARAPSSPPGPAPAAPASSWTSPRVSAATYATWPLSLSLSVCLSLPASCVRARYGATLVTATTRGDVTHLTPAVPPFPRSTVAGNQTCTVTLTMGTFQQGNVSTSADILFQVRVVVSRLVACAGVCERRGPRGCHWGMPPHLPAAAQNAAPPHALPPSRAPSRSPPKASPGCPATAYTMPLTPSSSTCRSSSPASRALPATHVSPSPHCFKGRATKATAACRHGALAVARRAESAIIQADWPCCHSCLLPIARRGGRLPAWLADACVLVDHQHPALLILGRRPVWCAPPPLAPPRCLPDRWSPCLHCTRRRSVLAHTPAKVCPAAPLTHTPYTPPPHRLHRSDRPLQPLWWAAPWFAHVLGHRRGEQSAA